MQDGYDIWIKILKDKRCIEGDRIYSPDGTTKLRIYTGSAQIDVPSKDGPDAHFGTKVVATFDDKVIKGVSTVDKVKNDYITYIRWDAVVSINFY